MIERLSPVSCLSGNGGTEMHGYFADNRSQSQSKCLNLWPTITCVCWKKSNITESLFWQFHFAWFLRIYGGKVKKCKHRKAVKYRDELKKKQSSQCLFRWFRNDWGNVFKVCPLISPSSSLLPCVSTKGHKDLV